MQIYHWLIPFFISICFISCEDEEDIADASFSYEVNQIFVINTLAGVLGPNVTSRTEIENVENLLLRQLSARGLSLSDVAEVRANSVRWVGLNGASLNFLSEASMELSNFDNGRGGIEFSFIVNQNGNIGSVLDHISGQANVSIFLQDETVDMIAKYRLNQSLNVNTEIRAEIVFDVVLN